MSVQTEGPREAQRTIELYNLDLILAVGYRVRSARGVEFRRYASTVLKEYLEKGFAMNDERLKNLGGGNYWKELLERPAGSLHAPSISTVWGTDGVPRSLR